jgi:2-iminobutanoate/2-iminopropanoate deaminase
MKMRDETIETETRQVFKNIKAVLKKADYNFENIIKTTIFLTDMDDFQKVNEIYGSYFEIGNEPARETVEVSGLPKGARVEISLIAIK